MNAIVEVVWQGMLAASWVEQAATVLGLISVWLSTRQSLWTFPLGLVQVVLIGSVFFEHRLYADTFLQGVFFVALVYGWWSWTHPGERRARLPVTRLSGLQLGALIVLGLVITAAWGRLLAQIGDPLPWRDAFIATFGILSQWLEARKKLEAWAGWVVVNIVALVVYATIGLYWFVMLYLLYLVLAFVGLHAWQVSYKNEIAA